MPHAALPCWYEIATPDPDATRAFYAAVLDWTWVDPGMPGMTYEIASAGEEMVAGMMATMEGQPPAWTFYVAVEDADASAEKARGLGATVIVPPMDIPETGRFAVLCDPQGAAFAILQPLPGGTGGAFDQERPGHGNWHDMGTPDPQAALEFYGALFGWAVSSAMQMGPEMTYNVLAAGGRDFGGIYNDEGPAAWKPYFGVVSAEAGADAIRAAGGEVTDGPSPVPGGAFMVTAKDPQGITFALVGGP